MKSTVVIIPYKNDIKFLDILDRILEADGEFNVLVVDNNPHPHLKPMMDEYPVKYIHNGNLGALAGAMNRAIDAIHTKFLVYVCSNHTMIYDNRWLLEMEDAMKEADMGGTLARFDGKNHIQGGVFIARTDKLREVRYDSIKFPFTFMDVYISDEFKKKGFKMIDINCVHSKMGKYKRVMSHKIVHAHIIS